MTDQPVDINSDIRINKYKIMLDEARYKLNIILTDQSRNRTNSIQLLIVIGATIALLAGGLEYLNLTEKLDYDTPAKLTESFGVVMKYSYFIYISMLTLLISVTCCSASIFLTRKFTDKSSELTEDVLQNKHSIHELYVKILHDYSEKLKNNYILISDIPMLLKASIITYCIGLVSSCLMIIESAYR